ncbi:uncharacterized protein M421DRAFT_342324 [Didymella exigua CBS 183.55]|uniref:Uncharacterized protein n=1 Tax=Didymella exigua CBS 183.55 TaxID=1150837 RepID=A0A6A5RTQ9_9PLEO|nr:uncharacterized protein M421DRAFT_342324 [Didymella exigua CBS 183.55]KAF1931232.1 hypothetical protein M421DRAFT_342324 [Didymella exigua CBS 183.55]
MRTHTLPTISLHSTATRLSRVPLSQYISRLSSPTKKDPFNRTSSPTKAKLLRTPMCEATQRDRMARPPTMSQQARPRRPYHIAHSQENAVRDVPGGARSVPEAPRKPHGQDRERRADVMKMLPRQLKPRRPLQKSDRSPEAPHCELRAAGPMPSKYSERTVDLFTMIDEHMAWNMSASDAESPRPNSSGTMFVDFGADGEVEVSYRNGMNKKLPCVPSTTPAPSQPASPRHTVDIKQAPKTAGSNQQHAEAHLKPQPHHHFHPSRHDSVIHPGASHTIDITQPPPFPPPSRSLPSLPYRVPLHPQSRMPQVHATSRSVSTAKTHRSAPAPSAAPTTTYRTARDIETRGARDAVYTTTKPEGMTVSYKSGGLTTSFRVNSAVHSHPEAQKQQYPNGSPPQRFYNPSMHSSLTHVSLKMDTNKPLPPLPPSSRDSDDCATRSRQLSALEKEKKRYKIARFVKTVLRKMAGLADKFDEHQHRYQRR